MKVVYRQEDGGFVVIEDGVASVYDMRPGLVPPGEFRESRQPTPTDLEAVAAEAVVAKVEPSVDDRIAALERLALAIAKSDPKTANLAELAVVESVVLSDAALEQPIL